MQENSGFNIRKDRKVLIFIICYFAYTTIYIARLNLSMASPCLKESGILNSAQIGLIGGLFSIIYAIGRLINGVLSDIKPPSCIICIGLFGVGISNILIGFLPHFNGILLLWCANAFAQSMLWSSILRIISNIFVPSAAKRINSYMVTSVATGNVLGILIGSFLVEKYGLRYAFMLPGILAVFSGIMVILITSRINIQSNTRKNFSLQTLLKNKELCKSIVPAMCHGVVKDNISLWMTLFFVSKFNIDLASTTYFVLFIPIVGFIGRLLYPPIFRVFRENEHTVSFFAFITIIIFSCLLCFSKISPTLAVIALSCIYASVSLINTSFLSVFPVSFAKNGNVASVSGIMDFSTYLGAGIGSLTYGFLIEHFGFSSMFVSWVFISVISLFSLKNLKKHFESGDSYNEYD